MANRNNKLVVPGSQNAIEQMKYEIASELGYPEYATMDKGDLPARVHGAIGGSITKRLIEMGQQALEGNATQQSNLDLNEYKQEMEQSLKH